MSESLLNCLGNMLDTIPTSAHYHELLCILSNLTGCNDFDEMRKKYGEYTYRQWGDLIAENTPKW